MADSEVTNGAAGAPSPKPSSSAKNKTPSFAQRKASAALSAEAGLGLQERFGSFIEANWPALVGLLAAIAVASLGWAGYDYWLRRAEGQAEDALYRAEAPYVKAKEGFDRAKMKALMPGFSGADEPGQPPAKPATGDLGKDYGAAVGALEDVVAKYPKSHASQQAALDLVAIYLEYKQPDKAALVAEKVGTGAQARDVMGALTLIALGDARATLGQCETAIAAWKKVLDEPRAAYLHPEVTVKSGVCYESMRQNDKAAEMYRKATTDFGESAAGQSAKSLLRALELKGAAGKAG